MNAASKSARVLDVVTLYRPVGTAELRLIEASGFRAFPPRLPEQPIFYPVLDEAYAAQIAREWNAKEGDGRGYVTRFVVRKSFLNEYDVQRVGGKTHLEYWIPADELHAFNEAIVGKIEVIATFEDGHRASTSSA